MYPMHLEPFSVIVGCFSGVSSRFVDYLYVKKTH